jgi:hypothetical protein
VKPPRLLPLLALLLLGACNKQGFLKAPDAAPEVSDKVGSFATDTHFLLEPSADAEDLLGRRVHLSSKGAWTIADERAPGCQVRVKRSAAEYQKSYRIGLGDMTAMSGGYSEILKLEARYGRSVEAAMKINNQSRPSPPTPRAPAATSSSTPCASAPASAACCARPRAAPAAALGRGPLQGRRLARGRHRRRRRDDLVEPAGLRLHLQARPAAQAARPPGPRPRARQRRRAASSSSFAATSDAYLVIFFLEESGAGAVLYPNSHRARAARQEDRERWPCRAPPRSPSPPRCATRKTGARETLVVYAFTNRADFDQFKPSAIGDGSDAVTYAANLTQALASVPISRWARATLTYEIRPKSP